MFICRRAGKRMSDPTLRPLFYASTEPDFQDWGDWGEIREEKMHGRKLFGIGWAGKDGNSTKRWSTDAERETARGHAIEGTTGCR
jgi:hypothetical protein